MLLEKFYSRLNRDPLATFRGHLLPISRPVWNSVSAADDSNISEIHYHMYPGNDIFLLPPSTIAIKDGSLEMPFDQICRRQYDMRIMGNTYWGSCLYVDSPQWSGGLVIWCWHALLAISMVNWNCGHKFNL